MAEAWIRLGAVACAASALTLSAWPARRWSGSRRAAALVALAGSLLALPLLVPREAIFLRIAAMLGLSAPFVPKLLDLGVAAERWRTLPFRRWAAFVFNPLVLVERVHAQRAPMPRRPAALLLARAALEMTAGWALLAWAFRARLEPFWLDHATKLAAGYLAVLDGGFVLLTAIGRLAGSPVMDLSRDPLLAVTPADFWRRYNCAAGRLLHDDVFVPAGGRRSPALGVLLVFAANGLLHEALSVVLTGRLLGYQLAFFGV